MSVSHLDAIKKKYGFQTLNVATWRDPKLSVHPARGGPKGPTISPDLAGKPFELTYKVRIKPPPPPPEPTDDEDSAGDEEANTEPADAPAAPVDLPPEPNAETSESNTEVPDGEPSPVVEPSPPIEASSEGTPAETQPESSEPDPPIEIASIEDPPSETLPDTASAPVAAPSNDQSNTSVPADSDEVDPSQPTDISTPSHDPSVEDTEAPPPPASEPLQPELDPDEIGEIVERTPGSFPGGDSIEPVQSPSGTSTLDDTSDPADICSEVPPPAPEPPSLATQVLDPNEIVAVEEPDCLEEKSPKIVQFAPGTPDPKPTNRKKKMGKGSKGKKKKTIVDVSGTGSPDDVVAIEVPASVQSEPIVETSAETLDDAGEALESTGPSEQPNCEPSAVVEVVAPEALSAEGSSSETPPTIEPEPGNDACGQATEEEIASVVIEETLPAKGKSKKKKASSKKAKDIPLSPPPDPLPPDGSEPTIVEAAPEPASVDIPKESSRDRKKKKSKNKSKEAESPPVITIPAGLGIDLSDILPDETLLETLPDGPKDNAKEDEGSSADTQATQLPANLDEPSSPDQGLELSTSVAEDDPAEPNTEAATSDKSEGETPVEDSAKPEPDVTPNSLAQPSEAEEIDPEGSPGDDGNMDAQHEGDGECPLNEAEQKENSVRDSAVDVESRKGSVDDGTGDHVGNEDELDEPISTDQPDELDEPNAWDEPLSDGASEAGSIHESEVELDTAGDSIDLADTQGGETVSGEDSKEAESSLEEPSEANDEIMAREPVEIDPESGAEPEKLEEEPESNDVVVAEDLSPPLDDEKEDLGHTGDSAPIEEAAVTEPCLEEVMGDNESILEEGASGGGQLSEDSDAGDAPDDVSLHSGTVDEAPVEDIITDSTEASSEPIAETPENAAGGSNEPISDEVVGTSNADDCVPDSGVISDEIAKEAVLESSDDVGVISDGVTASEEAIQPASELESQNDAVEPVEVVEESVPEVAAPALEIQEAPLEQAEDSTPSEAPECSAEAQEESNQLSGGDGLAEEIKEVPEAQEESESVDPPPNSETAAPCPVLEPETSPGEPVPEPSAVESPVAEQLPVVETIVIETSKEEPSQDAPPSPQLSRSSGSNNKADHWKREHKKRRSDDSKKSWEKPRSSKPARLPEGLRSTRDRSHRSSLMTAEELAARQRRREERKALEIARIQEEERRLAYEEELRRIRHAARRAARKAAAEEARRLAREEAEAVARKEAERRRRHREVRETDRPRPRRESKTSSSSIPKLLGFPLGQSAVRTSSNHVKSAYRAGDDERLDASTTRRYVLRDEDPRLESPTLPGSSPHGSRDGGSSGHHRRPRHHRTESERDRPEVRRRDSERHESDRPEMRRRESERHESGRSDEKRRRRPPAPEQKPKSFLRRLFA